MCNLAFICISAAVWVLWMLDIMWIYIQSVDIRRSKVFEQWLIYSYIPNYTCIHPSTTIHPRLITTHLINVLLNITNLLLNPFISAVRRYLNSGSFTLTWQITHTYTFNNNQPAVNNCTSHQFTPQYNQSSTKSLHIRCLKVLERQLIYSYLTNYTYIHPLTTIKPWLITTNLIHLHLNNTPFIPSSLPLHVQFT